MVIIAELETRKMFSTGFITLRVTAKPINDGGCDQLSKTFQDREAFSFATQTRHFPI